MARDDQAERDMALLPIQGEASTDTDGARLNEAAVWYMKLRKDDSAESTWIEFALWLEADTDNRVAFDLVEDLYFALDEVEPHLMQANHTATKAAASELGKTVAPFRRSTRMGIIGLGLMAASLLVVVAIRSGDVGRHVDRYATGIGEKRTVTLADGSLIDMNAASAIAVSLVGHERKVTLEQGEAVFRVVHDPSRPFVVSVADRDVRDVGTVFDVSNDHERVVVTVASGEVAVSSRSSGDKATPVSLNAGDQLMIQAGQADSVHRVDPASTMAWRDGYLTYNEAPLSLVVSDLNRYFPKRIILKDDGTGERRFSGAIKVDNEDAVVSRLTQLIPLVVDRSGDGVITLRLKQQPD